MGRTPCKCERTISTFFITFKAISPLFSSLPLHSTVFVFSVSRSQPNRAVSMHCH
jgi:hypothetical protein